MNASPPPPPPDCRILMQGIPYRMTGKTVTSRKIIAKETDACRARMMLASQALLEP